MHRMSAGVPDAWLGAWLGAPVSSSASARSLLAHIIQLSESAEARVVGNEDERAVLDAYGDDVVRVTHGDLRSPEVRASFNVHGGPGAFLGRIGPAAVTFPTSSARGQIELDRATLAVRSLANFSSLRANVAVTAGRWMYEVELCTSGVIQVGWATAKTRFTHEEGVGDAPDSFAYDGRRVCRWNRFKTNYGERWECGDVIGCLIDMDERTISFSRNGRSLGVAFTRDAIPGESFGVAQAATEAYYPAISVSQHESVVVNFGSRPFRFPFDGYRPLEPAAAPARARGGRAAAALWVSALACASGRSGSPAWFLFDRPGAPLGASAQGTATSARMSGSGADNGAAQDRLGESVAWMAQVASKAAQLTAEEHVTGSAELAGAAELADSCVCAGAAGSLLAEACAPLFDEHVHATAAEFAQHERRGPHEDPAAAVMATARQIAGAVVQWYICAAESTCAPARECARGEVSRATLRERRKLVVAAVSTTAARGAAGTHGVGERIAAAIMGDICARCRTSLFSCEQVALHDDLLPLLELARELLGSPHVARAWAGSPAFAAELAGLFASRSVYSAENLRSIFPDVDMASKTAIRIASAAYERVDDRSWRPGSENPISAAASRAQSIEEELVGVAARISSAQSVLLVGSHTQMDGQGASHDDHACANDARREATAGASGSDVPVGEMAPVDRVSAVQAALREHDAVRTELVGLLLRDRDNATAALRALRDLVRRNYVVSHSNALGYPFTPIGTLRNLLAALLGNAREYLDEKGVSQFPLAMFTARDAAARYDAIQCLGGVRSHVQKEHAIADVPDTAGDVEVAVGLVDIAASLFSSGVGLAFDASAGTTTTFADALVAAGDEASSFLQAVRERGAESARADARLREALESSGAEARAVLRSALWSSARLLQPDMLRDLERLAGFLSGVLQRAADSGPILAHIPETYLRTASGLLNVIRRSHGVAELVASKQYLVLSLFRVLLRCSDDPRVVLILKPEMLLGTVQLSLSHPGIADLVAEEDEIAERLFTIAADNLLSRQWVAGASILSVALHMSSSCDESSSSEDLSIPPLGRRVLAAALARDDLLEKVLDRLFNNLNWTLSELDVTMGEVPSDDAAEIPPTIVRNMSIMIELATQMFQPLVVFAWHAGAEVFSHSTRRARLLELSATPALRFATAARDAAARRVAELALEAKRSRTAALHDSQRSGTRHTSALISPAESSQDGARGNGSAGRAEERANGAAAAGAQGEHGRRKATATTRERLQARMLGTISVRALLEPAVLIFEAAAAFFSEQTDPSIPATLRDALGSAGVDRSALLWSRFFAVEWPDAWKARIEKLVRSICPDEMPRSGEGKPAGITGQTIVPDGDSWAGSGPASGGSSDVPEDALCTICWDRVADTMFAPCQHRSCRACIDRHLMQSKQCFYCKADIEGVAPVPSSRPPSPK